MTEPSRVDVLAFGAHPDDVELTMGGTLAKLASRGHRIGIVDFTRGEKSTRGSVPIRNQESAEAARILGAALRRNLELPDGHLAIDQDSRTRVVGAIRELKPGLVLGPAEQDLHPDHRVAGALVREACFLAGVRKWGEGEPHRPSTLLTAPGHGSFEPQVVVDVSQSFETKRAACLAYKSQFFDPDSEEAATYISDPRYWAWWEARATAMGERIGVRHGEGFLHAGPIPLEDPFEHFQQLDPRP